VEVVVRCKANWFRFLALVCLLTLGAVTATAGPHRVIDLRTRTDPAEYEIGLCARPSPDTALNLPGHAFVSFSSKLAGQPRHYVAVGHTTNANLGRVLLSYLKPLGSVPGHLAEEVYTSTKEQCLVAKVNKEAFNKAMDLTRDPLSKLGVLTSTDEVRIAYSLGAQDCMTFMTAVARTIGGVKIPPRLETDLPLPYLRKLIEQN
jgi:hypothetical protein